MKEVYYYDPVLCIRIKTTRDKVIKVLKRCNDKIRNLQKDITHNDVIRLFDSNVDCPIGECYTIGYPGVKLIAEYKENDFGDLHVEFVTVPDEEYEE